MKTNLSEATRDYLGSVTLRGSSPRTVSNYQATLSKLYTFLSHEAPDTVEDLNLVTGRLLERWLSHESQRLAPTSVAKLHREVKSFLRWLVAGGDLDRNPLENVPAPKAPIVKVPLITRDDVKKMIDAPARTEMLRRRNEAMIRTLWDTGLRAGELLSLRLADVQLATRTLVVTGKSGVRTVPVGEKTATALRRYRAVRAGHRVASETDAFWIGGRGAMKYQALHETLERVCRYAGVDPVHAHQFRHTVVHEALNNGATVLEVQALGGWSSVAVLSERYGTAGAESRMLAAHRRFSPGDRL